MCNYASAKQWQGPKFTSDDFRGRFLTGAIKGDLAIMGTSYQNLPLGSAGAVIRVDRSNYELVAPAWAALAAKWIASRNYCDRVVIAPLPSSKTTPATATYRTLHLANLVQAALGGTSVVWSGVRFRQERQKVHEGGDRATIFEDMVLVSDVPSGVIVPLDDVYTMGSHLNALMKHLPDERWPDLMVCGGRTIWDTPEKRAPDEFKHSFYG